MANVRRLVDIVKRLRGPGGCPWDKEQTFQTLKPYILEEAYELYDALESGDIDNLKEELGDVLLHVVMISEMTDEQGFFNLDDVTATISEKMIRRHPHVFGDTQVNSAEEVLTNWEAIKKTEKPTAASVMDSIPRSLPALSQAHKIQKKASKLGFDWPSAEGALDKCEEEFAEFREELKANQAEKMEDELGDILFSVVNVCRKLKIDPEQALRKSNQKFVKRFSKMEEHLPEGAEGFKGKSIAQLDALWEAAKLKLD
jgi:tetrapyrrole methylase family protein/MazG family protein